MKRVPALPQVSDVVLQRALGLIGSAVNFVLSEFLQVALVTVTLDTSTVAVRHGLGRVPRGFLLARSSADVRVWEDTTVAATVTEISLVASSAESVTLLMF
jgi:hypothetical protein